MSPIIDLTTAGGPNGPSLVFRVALDNGYEYEFHPGKALVFKGQATEHSYTINHAGCDCPSAVYGNRPCKHEKPLSIRSDGAESEESGGVILTGPSSGMSADEADALLNDLLG